MAIRTIRTYPDDVLRQKAEPVSDVRDTEIQTLIDDMAETMYDAPGVGLAANQVGVPLRICVIDTSGKDQEGPLLVLINPEITAAEGRESCEEGCLSVPGYFYDVTRAERVTVSFLDRSGTPTELSAEGLLARAIQHEMDHMDGVLFVDRMSLIKKEMFRRRFKHALSRATA